MRFAIVMGSGMIANAITTLNTAQGIIWFVVLLIAVLFDMAEYGQRDRLIKRDQEGRKP